MKRRKIIAIILSALLVSNSIGNLAWANTVGSITTTSNVQAVVPVVEEAIPRTQLTATATSQQGSDPASSAIDGNLTTMWHTNWSGSDVLPQSLTIGLGETANVTSIQVTPRSGTGANGVIREYEIYAINNGTETKIANGKWADDGLAKTVILNAPVAATSIKITALQGNGGFASIAEVNVFKNKAEVVKLASYSNLRISGSNQVDITSDMSKIGALEEGTIIARFKKSTTGIQSLISVSNDTTANGHFHLYTSDGIVGYELRSQVGTTTTDLSKQSVSTALNPGFNTVALKVTKGVGYKIFVNGVLAKEIADVNAKLSSGVPGANKAFVGKTDRSSGNEYVFNGDIDFIDVYGQPISDNYIISKTGETSKPSDDSLLPEGAIKTQPQNIFYPGFLNSGNYRIPALLTTKTGTVLASIDARKGGGHDSPNNIDTAIRRSEDGGKTWDAGKIVLDFPDTASAIDTSLLQDSTTGEIFLIVTHFANGYGFGNSKTGSGYKTIEGKRYRQLFNASNAEYTIREDGKVYDSNNAITNFTVDVDMNLYKDGVKVSNVLGSTSELKVLGTAHIVMVSSKDDGKTWSKPIDLNKDLKDDWMRFFGTGPGKGHEIKNGPKAGRLVFPIYYTNAAGGQSSAVIYSDDHGVTWKKGESPNDGRKLPDGTIINSQDPQGKQLTESQVVEMPNGQLKLFMRNTGNTPSGKVAIATSFDGGETWDETVDFDSNLTEVYCQLSVINYSQKIEGKDAIIFANPSGSGRSNGKVRVGLITQSGSYTNGEPKYAIEWKYNKLAVPGFYAYSCLTELANGNIGLFYEGTGSLEMSYTEMNLEYLKFDASTVAPTTKLSSVTLEDSDTKYLQGEDVNMKLSFDLPVAIMGNRNFTLKLGTTEIPLTLNPSTNAKDFILTGKIPASMANGKYNAVLKANPTADINNVYNKVLVINEDKPLNVEVTVGQCDKTALQTAVTIADALVESNYTVASWSAFKTKLDEAKVVLGNNDATQEVVDASKAALELAQGALVLVNGRITIATDSSISVNKAFDVSLGISNLKSDIEAYAAEFTVTYNPEVFNYNSVSKAKDGLIVTGKKVKDGEVKILVSSLGTAIANNTELAKINLTPKKEAVDEIFAVTVGKVSDGTVISNLELSNKKITVQKEIASVDKTQLQNSVTEAEKLQVNLYTPQSWSVFNNALNEAKSVLSDINTTQNDIDTAKAALEKAKVELVEKASKAALNSLITESETLQQAQYTSASWSIFKLALDEAKVVIANENATQAQVDNIKASLENTKNALIQRGDKLALQASINLVPVLAQKEYTIESWSKYQTALETAKVVNSNVDAVQIEIDNAKNELDNSFKELKVIIVSKVQSINATVTNNSASLTWQAPINAEGVKEYVIYKDGKVVGRVNSQVFNYTATGLRANTIYGFKISVVYTNGVESKPVSLNIRTTTNVGLIY